MSILTIENTIISNYHVCVTAVVEDMHLACQATHEDPSEWAPALCTASFELATDESIPVDEDRFCQFLERLDLHWEPVIRDEY